VGLFRTKHKVKQIVQTEEDKFTYYCTCGAYGHGGSRREVELKGDGHVADWSR
jgi:hypothetical protein